MPRLEQEGILGGLIPIGEVGVDEARKRGRESSRAGCGGQGPCRIGCKSNIRTSDDGRDIIDAFLKETSGDVRPKSCVEEGELELGQPGPERVGVLEIKLRRIISNPRQKIIPRPEPIMIPEIERIISKLNRG